nr:hypothetical protein [Tanacetum cinerariifolium]
KIILRHEEQSLTLKCSDTLSISYNKFESLNKVDLIDGKESDFNSEEIENFLDDDSIPIGIENSVFDPDGDIPFLEKLLNEDLPPMNLNQAKSSIEEPEYSFSMGYEHFSTTLVTKLDKVAESSIKNLVPIPHEYEDYSIPFFNVNEIYSDELESHVETNFVESLSNHNALINSSQKIDYLEEIFGLLMPIRIAEEEQIRREHAEYISLMERSITINPCPRPTVNANMIVEFFPSSLIPVQDNDSQREEIDIVTDTDGLLPPGFENDDSEGEIDASDFDNPLFPRPPSEPPDAKFDFELDAREEISVVMNDNNELECLDPRDENDEDDDYFPFMFVIRIFLPYLIFSKVFLFLLSTESEDTIFDPCISV